MISHPPPHQTLCVMSYVVRSHDLVFKMEPEALVGRQVRVHWRDDDAWFMGSVIGYDPETGRHKVRVVNGQRHWLQPRNRTAHKVCVVYGQRHWLRRRNRMAHKVRVVYGQRHWMQPRNRTAHKVRVVSGQRHWLQPRNRTAQGARG